MYAFSLDKKERILCSVEGRTFCTRGLRGTTGISPGFDQCHLALNANHGIPISSISHAPTAVLQELESKL